MLAGVRDRLRGFERLVAAPFVWMRISPSVVTLLALLPAAGAAWYSSQRDWFPALALGTLAASFDMIDGTVARVRNRITPFGGYLDSVVDRVVDILFLFGLGFALRSDRGWLLVGACVAGALGTSYARARAYQSVAVPNNAWNDFFERPERSILLGVGVLAQGVLDAQDVTVAWSDQPAIEGLLALLALASLATFLQRVFKVRRMLRAAPPQ